MLPAPVKTRPGSRPATVLLVVSAAVFLANLDLFIVNLALPAIRATFPGGNLATASWVLNGYTVAFAALLAPSGRLADRYGRRRLFLIGTAVFTLGSAACAAATSMPLLIAFRAVQAVGAALIMPASLALLLTAFPAARRAVAMSVWAAVGGAAAAIGPLLAGVLVPVTWRWVFLVNLPVCALALVFGPRVLPETRDDGTGVPDLLGAVQLMLGIGALAWALVEAPDRGWGDAVVLTGFGVALVALVAVVRRSARHPVPALALSALRVPAMWPACLAMLLFTTAFGAMLLGTVLFLTGVWHDPVLTAGLSLAPGPVMVVVVSLTLGGRLTRRFGAGPVTVAGSVCFALGAVWWLWRMGEAPAFVTGLLPGLLLTGVGVGLNMPALSGVVGSALPAPQWGAGSSVINTARQIGTVLGTAVLVVLLGPAPDLADFRLGWIFLTATALAAAVAALALRPAREL